MDRIFRVFVDSLRSNADLPALKTAMTDIVSALDLGVFAYLFEDHQFDAGVKLISNYPIAWTSHYLANGYQEIDPVIDKSRKTSEPFQWGYRHWSPQLHGPQIHLLEEAAGFGIQCGFTVPVRDSLTRIAAITFAAVDSDAKFARCVEKHGSLLQLLAILFHSRARLSLEPERSVSGVILSPREYECLEWAAKGKSAWAIGRILNISRRTAAFHLDNAKSKLGVRTISQAVALLAVSMQFTR